MAVAATIKTTPPTAAHQRCTFGDNHLDSGFVNKIKASATGTVDMQAYVGWLRNHGYTFAGTKEN